MSKIKNTGLDQYGTEPFEQRQFETAGVDGVKVYYESNGGHITKCAENYHNRMWTDKVVAKVHGCNFICLTLHTPVYIHTSNMTGRHQGPK